LTKQIRQVLEKVLITSPLTECLKKITAGIKSPRTLRKAGKQTFSTQDTTYASDYFGTEFVK